jgi:hypothetical protein
MDAGDLPTEDPVVLARSVAVGFAGGAVGVPLFLVVGWSVRNASELVFALGALAFGFGLTSWASAILLGGTLDEASEQLDLDRRWTSADSRNAMSVITAFGAAAMVGAPVATVAVQGV